MFSEEYKKAYQSIRPNRDSVEELLKKAGSKRKRPAALSRFTVAAATLTTCLLLGAVPVCAAHIPAVYRIIELISPEMADLFIPIEKTGVSQGIEMTVEAIELDGNEAEIIVSFRDTTGQDRIRGKVDLYDSYGLISRSEPDLVSSGCRFIEFDEAAGKAYFNISLRSDKAFDREKLTFYTRELLCGLTEEKLPIDISNPELKPGTKKAALRGWGGSVDAALLPEILQGAPENTPSGPSCSVLDMADAGDCPADGFAVTGVAYTDGMLKVQICMGDNTHADRHVQPFLLDATGKEQDDTYTVSWFEDLNGIRYTFYEYWFPVPQEDLENYTMYGIFYDSGESVEGNWRVTFRLEQ